MDIEYHTALIGLSTCPLIAGEHISFDDRGDSRNRDLKRQVQNIYKYRVKLLD